MFEDGKQRNLIGVFESGETKQIAAVLVDPTDQHPTTKTRSRRKKQVIAQDFALAVAYLVHSDEIWIVSFRSGQRGHVPCA